MELNKRIGTIFFLLIFCNLLLAQPHKYWVAFKDKNGTPYTLSSPSAFLGQKAIDRRTAYDIPMHFSDLPVVPSYLQQVEDVPNVRVLYAVKWLNGVVIAFDSAHFVQAAMDTISTFAFVDNSRKVKRGMRVNIPVSKEPAQSSTPVNMVAEPTAYQYGGSYWQNHQLNVDCLHEKGFRGQGMTIAVMDAGFESVMINPIFDSLHSYGNLLGTRDFVNGGTNGFVGGHHGTNVLSCLAANQPGLILGSAPMAKYWLLRTEDGPSETISEEYNWIRAAEFADSVGADILTTSLGYTEFNDPQMNHTYNDLNGRTAPMSIAATMAARKGMFVLNAAGNEGEGAWHFISVAADADSVCAVGAVDSAGNVAHFSGAGPTSDGRIKPDLVARGAGAWVSSGESVCFPANGTSFSTPILAGAVACYWQAHKTMNNIEVLNTLRNNASNGLFPNNRSGWGIPSMCPVTADNEAYATGRALLRNMKEHAGIKVKFTPLSLNGKSDSAITAADGRYTIKLVSGAHRVTFSKDQYFSQKYSDTLLATLSNTTTLKTVTLEPVNAGPAPTDPEFDFIVYDPGTSVMQVQFPRSNYQFINIQVYDLLGRLLFNFTPSSGGPIVDFNASHLPDNIYILRVETSDGTKVKKFYKR
jgi:serine protease AprX